MNKADIVDSVSEKTGLTKKQANEAVNTTLEAIQAGVQLDGKVAIVGFGSFTKQTTKERMGRNPSTGAEMLIKSKEKVKFSPSKDFLN